MSILACNSCGACRNTHFVVTIIACIHITVMLAAMCVTREHRALHIHSLMRYDIIYLENGTDFPMQVRWVRCLYDSTKSNSYRAYKLQYRSYGPLSESVNSIYQ